MIKQKLNNKILYLPIEIWIIKTGNNNNNNEDKNLNNL